MNETDAMKLLAEANPVRMDTIGAVELPDSLFATRRPARRLVLAAALVLLAALAASFIGVFGFAGPRSHSDASNRPRGRDSDPTAADPARGRLSGPGSAGGSAGHATA